MILVKPSFTILTPVDPVAIIKRIEAAGRTCYKSEDKITEDSAQKFCSMILTRNHVSVIEHESISVRVICDRGVSHEIVRHRLASYSQESTRYVNYGKRGMSFIIPLGTNLQEGVVEDPRSHVVALQALGRNAEAKWLSAMRDAEVAYNDLLALGWKPEMARSVLPNSLKTEIVMTANLREWIHFFGVRTARAAHPQMREIATPLLEEFKKIVPCIFEHIIPYDPTKD